MQRFSTPLRLLILAAFAASLSACGSSGSDGTAGSGSVMQPPSSTAGSHSTTSTTTSSSTSTSSSSSSETGKSGEAGKGGAGGEAGKGGEGGAGGKPGEAGKSGEAGHDGASGASGHDGKSGDSGSSGDGGTHSGSQGSGDTQGGSGSGAGDAHNHGSGAGDTQGGGSSGGGDAHGSGSGSAHEGGSGSGSDTGSEEGKQPSTSTAPKSVEASALFTAPSYTATCDPCSGKDGQPQVNNIASTATNVNQALPKSLDVKHPLQRVFTKDITGTEAINFTVPTAQRVPEHVAYVAFTGSINSSGGIKLGNNAGIILAGNTVNTDITLQREGANQKDLKPELKANGTVKNVTNNGGAVEVYLLPETKNVAAIAQQLQALHLKEQGVEKISQGIDPKSEMKSIDTFGTGLLVKGNYTQSGGGARLYINNGIMAVDGDVNITDGAVVVNYTPPSKGTRNVLAIISKKPFKTSSQVSYDYWFDGEREPVDFQQVVTFNADQSTPLYGLVFTIYPVQYNDLMSYTPRRAQAVRSTSRRQAASEALERGIQPKVLMAKTADNKDIAVTLPDNSPLALLRQSLLSATPSEAASLLKGLENPSYTQVEARQFRLFQWAQMQQSNALLSPNPKTIAVRLNGQWIQGDQHERTRMGQLSIEGGTATTRLSLALGAAYSQFHSATVTQKNSDSKAYSASLMWQQQLPSDLENPVGFALNAAFQYSKNTLHQQVSWLGQTHNWTDKYDQKQVQVGLKLYQQVHAFAGVPQLSVAPFLGYSWMYETQNAIDANIGAIRFNAPKQHWMRNLVSAGFQSTISNLWNVSGLSLQLAYQFQYPIGHTKDFHYTLDKADFYQAHNTHLLHEASLGLGYHYGPVSVNLHAQGMLDANFSYGFGAQVGLAF